jgi:hypothetical protein
MEGAAVSPSPLANGFIVRVLPSRLATAALVAAVVLGLLVGPSVPASAVVDADAEASFLTSVNQERQRRGIAALKVCTELRAVARSHSARMASVRTLHHNPNLRTDVPSWLSLAENVGHGASVATLHSALMNSEGHRRNILDGQLTQVGIGVEVVGGTMWVTQVFRRPASGAACTAPTTASPPAVMSAPESEVRLEGDFTGTGRTDVATYSPSTGRWTVSRSTGSGLVDETWGAFTTRTGWSDHLVGDFDGDGRDDLASYHPGEGTWWVSLASPTAGFVLRAF